MPDSVRFDLKVPIPQKKNGDGKINGDVSVYIPKDVESWKKKLEKHLENEEVMHLSITDGYGADFALIFSEFPDAHTVNGLENGELFGITMERETLETLGRAIQFALQENTISKKAE